MVVFDQLRISDDGTKLYINMHVNEASYFDDVYLSTITIATSDVILESYNEGTSVASLPTDYIYKLTFDEDTKEASLVLDVSSFDEAFAGTGSSTASVAYTDSSLSGPLFFIYVVCDGVPDDCTPCSLSNETVIALTFDSKLLHNKVMEYTKKLANTCDIPKDFINFILLWNAFKSSIETDHYIPAITYYNWLFNSYGAVSVNTNTCRCHG